MFTIYLPSHRPRKYQFNKCPLATPILAPSTGPASASTSDLPAGRSSGSAGNHSHSQSNSLYASTSCAAKPSSSFGLSAGSRPYTSSGILQNVAFSSGSGAQRGSMRDTNANADRNGNGNGVEPRIVGEIKSAAPRRQSQTRRPRRRPVLSPRTSG